MEFQGREELIARLDAAVTQDTVEEITDAVQDALVDVITERKVNLGEAAKVPCAEHYARRLLYKSPEHGYTVIAMIWGPDQGTPVHDHSGVWCVEGVLDGDIDVVQYDLKENEGERCRFEAQQTVRASVGSAGSLIPPFEYHTIANAHSDRSSITVHVYGKELETCSTFQQAGDGWYERKIKPLGYN